MLLYPPTPWQLRKLRHDVECIQYELESLKDFLRDVDATEEKSPNLRRWIREIRELSYDSEDVIAKCIFLFLRRMGPIEKVFSIIRYWEIYRQISSEIKAIRSRFENIPKRKILDFLYDDKVEAPKSATLLANSWSDYQRLFQPFSLEKTDMVGIEMPVAQLIRSLLWAEDGLTVISVVGAAGLGKTTLVRMVYNDDAVRYKFSHLLWITVSKSRPVEHILRDMLMQLGDSKAKPYEGYDAISASRVKYLIGQHLERMRYLIVLDDIWEVEAWQSIRSILPQSDRRACIVITTQIRKVAASACHSCDGYVYNLKPLSQQNSAELFNKIAFHTDHYSCPDYLRVCYESILKKCSGWPLAIVEIAGLLATKDKTVESWDAFNRKFIGDIFDGESFKTLKNSMSERYYDLPNYLKYCLLYLSIFPEGAVIHKQKLIRMWIADGLAEEKENQTAEDVAECCLYELHNRCLIEVDEISSGIFLVNDLLREFLVRKSREQNFFLLSRQGKGRQIDKIRRLAIHGSINKQALESSDLKHLRSMYWIDGMGTADFETTLHKMLRGCCRLLKVLHFDKAPFHSIPNEVFKLYNLKYLCLSNTLIEHIPESIKNLCNLETLDLVDSFVTELPIEILQLSKLRHILAYKSELNLHVRNSVQGFVAPSKIGQCLLSLKTLDCMDLPVTDCEAMVREIGNLTQLQILGITKLINELGVVFCSSLGKLTNLRRLRIFSGSETSFMDLDHNLSNQEDPLPFLQSLEISGRLKSIPKWISSLYGLKELYLRWSSFLEEDFLDCLGGLPNLTLLHMYGANLTRELIFRRAHFLRLKELRLEHVGGLRLMRVEEGSMPLLESLMLRYIDEMEYRPEDLEKLTNLKYVSINNSGMEFRENLRRYNEMDKSGLEHVTTIKFQELEGTDLEEMISSSSQRETERLGEGKDQEIHPSRSYLLLGQDDTSSFKETEVKPKNMAIVTAPDIKPPVEQVRVESGTSHVRKETRDLIPEPIHEISSSNDSMITIKLGAAGQLSNHLDMEFSKLFHPFSQDRQHSQDKSGFPGLDPEKDGYLFIVEKKTKLPEYTIYEGGKESIEPSSAKIWIHAGVMILPEQQVISFPDQNCPNLVLLFLQRNNILNHIPSTIFSQMPSLCFLDLSNTRIKTLPDSLFTVSSLQVLLLRNCFCLNSIQSDVKNIYRIEVLDLCGTELYDLPNEIDGLVRLKDLQVSFYGPDEESEYANLKLPSELCSTRILSKLHELQALSITVHPEDNRWAKIAGEIVKDLIKLKKLNYLQFYFPEVEDFQTFIQISPSWNKQELKIFKLIVGHNIKRITSRVSDDVEQKYDQQSGSLKYVNGEEEVPEEIKAVLKRANAFDLDHHVKIQSLSEFGVPNFEQLKFCLVRECPNVEIIIGADERSQSVFPSLEYLGIYCMWKLEQINKYPLPPGSFQELKYLRIDTCHNLKFILSISMIRCLSKLEELVVEDCEALTQIVEEELMQTVDDDVNFLPELAKLELRYLPQLVRLGNGLSLKEEQVTVHRCPNLKLNEQPVNLLRFDIDIANLNNQTRPLGGFFVSARDI